MRKFSADISLFDSELEGGVARADTPEACDEESSRLAGLLDDLDARFGDVDDFVDQIEEKGSFRARCFSKKQQLLEHRQSRVARLFPMRSRSSPAYQKGFPTSGP